jgi:hypothetical protein
MFHNQGREQPLQPKDHSGCRCSACRDELQEVIAPTVLCNVCHAAEPVAGTDQCDACLQALEDAQDALVARYNAALAA